MRRARLLILFVLLGLAVPAAAQARTSIVEVQNFGSQTVGTLERLEFDLTHDVTDERIRLILHSEADRARLAAAGYPAREIVADVEEATRDARGEDQRAVSARGLSGLPSGRETYRSLSEYHDELDTLAASNPTLVRRADLPRPDGTPAKSVEGRDLRGIEIASEVTRNDDGRPVYVVMGLHHAREWPSGEVNMEFARDLVQNYGTDRRITNLLDNVRVFVFPVINPDGFVVSRGDVDPPTPPTKALQRKNCQYDTTGEAEPCANRDSVDLNRNYGAYWGGNGASTSPSSDTYRGVGPWSEPESTAVHEFSQGLHITNFQSIHNIASLVLRPPGFKALGLAPDEDRLKALGDAMGEATGYASEFGYELYEVTGATEDWNYVAQNAFGYTIELGPAELSPLFQGPYDTHVVQQYLGADRSIAGGDGVREALLLAGEQAADSRDHSVIRGTATPGSVLRLRKQFTTTTSPICRPPYGGGDTDCPATDPAFGLADELDTSLVVPASGRYEWHISPSTRPFERKAGNTEEWTLRCESPGGAPLDERQLVIGIGESKTGDPCDPASAFVTSGEPGAGGGGGGSSSGSSGGGSSDGGSAPAGAPPAPPIAPAAPAAGLRAPTPAPTGLTFTVPPDQRRSVVLDRGLLVRARCGAAPCTLGASVRRSAPARTAALGRVFGRRTVRLGAGQGAASRVRLSSAARRYVQRNRVGRVVLRLDTRSGSARRVRSRGVRLVTR